MAEEKKECYKPQILSGFFGFLSQIQRIDCSVCDLFQTDSFCVVCVVKQIGSDWDCFSLLCAKERTGPV